jgi:FtsP/CotA-like multicopper oxidase with cupredoxin domain
MHKEEDDMNPKTSKYPRLLTAAMTLLLFAASNMAWAVVDGVAASTFNLTARADYISSADGNVHYAWGYANGNGRMQYPGVTMIVNQGDTVTVTLSNELPVPAPVSMVFPGQSNVVASGGTPGLMTSEVLPGGGSVTYSFVAGNPGTYLYHSGSNPALQVEMGLLGALIVRPASPDPLHQAYAHPGTSFDHEYLFLITEMDPLIHAQVDAQVMANPASVPVVDTSAFRPTLWFLNGRNAPDVMLDANVPWLPTQPYNCLPRMHAGEKILMRVINAGRDLHPLHTHGNNTWLIARDGRLLESAPGMGPDLAESNFTLRTVPGETYDATFEWTGKGLGWDAYGHAPGDALAPNEYAADHGKPIPVILPNIQDLSYGAHYSGSPYLGQFGALPPGQTPQGENGGYFHMWHSHNEKEITNDDIFPGGMMTMLVIEPAGVTIP